MSHGEAKGNMQLMRWGQGQHPVLIMDNFHPAPHELIASIKDSAEFTHQSQDLYPGVRAKASTEYTEFLRITMNDVALPLLKFQRAVDTDAKQTNSPFCLYSRANTPVKDLLPIQCIPHFDIAQDTDPQSDQPTQWALVHYLFDAPLGGTGFFRHRSSGLEAITKQSVQRYQRMLNDDIYKSGKPKQVYLQADHPLFALQSKVEGKFNRAVLYPAHVLHTGLVDDEHIVKSGHQRLTGNALFTLG